MAPRPPSSRIPRAHSTSTAPPVGPPADENAPPARPTSSTARGAAAAGKGVRISAIPLAPATKPTRTVAQLKSALTSSRQSTASARPVAHVVIQGPSSDPPAADGPDSLDLATSQSKAGFHDEHDDDGDHDQQHPTRAVQMPTPPNSQESSSAHEAVLTDQGDHGLLAPARATRRTRSPSSQPSTSRPTATTTTAPRRASRSPGAETIPDGPSHAPHILAARRRSSMSVSPHPPSASSAAAAPVASTSTGLSTATPARTDPATKVKGKRTKLRPRASEILDAPLAAPDADDADGELDPLLILGPEHTRGRGEGRRKRSMAAQAQAQVHGRASYAPTAGSSGRAARADEAARAAARLPTPPATQEDADDVVPVYQPLVFGVDEAAQGDAEDPADLGGFDAPAYYDDEGQIDAEPFAADAVDSVAQDGMHDDDEGGFAHLDEADSSAGGYSSGDDGAVNADAHLAADSSASDNEDAGAEPTSLHALGQIPTVRRTRPSYPPLSPNRTGEWDSTIAVELGSSPPPPMREPTPGFGGARRRSVDGAAGAGAGARSRPSYPPLSPNTTGEFDSQCPVRLGSSPPPSPSPGASHDGELGGEAARGRPASSEWRDEVGADVKDEDDVTEDAFLAPRRSTPIPGPSTAARASTTTSTSTPSNLLFLSAYRSPSPAISPILRSGGSSHSPHRPRLNFVSPSKNRDHLTNLVVPSPSSARARTQSRSPSPLAAPSSSTAAAAPAPIGRPSPGPSANPQQPRSTWTRGPAFFRSSSFSPPAHAALPRTATLYARRPGQSQEARDEDEAEGSREYHRYADLTATSPMPVGEDEGGVSAHGRAQEEERDEEGEAEVVVVGLEPERLEREQGRARSLSRSASPASGSASASAQSPSQDKDDVGPPTPAKDRHSSPAANLVSPAHVDDDEAMASPSSSASSTRSRRSSLASPARSINGDVLMSSPSPRNSPVVAAGARSPGSPSPSASVAHEHGRDEPQQPAATPGRRLLGDQDDTRMASPSPARQGSPLKARIGELVGGGRTKLQGLLFGPRASTPRDAQAEADEGVRDAAQAHDEPARRAHAEEQDDADDEPFQLQPAPTKASRSRAPASVADSTFTSLSHSRSHASFASSTSTSTSHQRRRRPSHPTLPVIEITSTDPRAAARAAAILKVHHKYVEQGFTAVDAARAAASAFDAAEAAGEQDGDSEDEEELRTLLLDAEDELRDQAPPAARSASASTVAPSTTSAAVADVRWTSHEWRKLEQALVELPRRQRRATSAAPSMGARSMRSESIAMASVIGDECEPEAVVEAFLRSVGVTREQCVGEWAWDTLIIRVEALKARRGKDARQRRASSFASTSHAESRLGPRTSIHEHVEPQHAQVPPSPSEEGASDDEPTPEAHPVVKQEQLSDEDDLDDAQADAESDEDGELADDTFFSSSKRDRTRRQRRGSVEPVYVPTALANPALRHLYDDFQPEKPKLPLKEVTRDDSPSSSSSSAAGEDEERGDLTASGPRESTPGAAGDFNEPPKSPSSAQRLMSYLGSFVRRSPAPAPSPASSTRALPADSSASPSPSPEMQQVQLSASLVTPRFASTSKPYPPLPTSATHKPLPPVADRVVRPLPQHRSDPSTSRTSLVAGAVAVANESTSAADTSGSSANSSTSFSSSRRRRRSSGEGNNTSLGRVWAAVDAIEEAESSREEEESRIIELLRSGSAAKRRAAGGDLRERTEDVSSASAASGSGSKGKGKGREVEWSGFVELDEELGRGMIPSGARALDRRPSGERRVSRR